ncbi:MAG TPA: hypothetical protein VM782_08745 [Stellaceae bacterium]|nr:hypothetical protein [Stellaceae bacterium]
MADLSRPERLQIMLSADEIRVLDDWRFGQRMPSRAAAIRELLKRGLAVEGIDLDTAGKQSSSFGVLSDSSGDTV